MLFVNLIRCLVNGDGKKTKDEEKIKESARNSTHILSRVEPSISTEVNQRLLSCYSVDEVVAALKEMGPINVLGEDKFLTLFFRIC
ncbi:hypothetical protein EPI10_024678 [Gossypium australe]|uniref:Uncharacterized protein n=1 Tax=Gossypium australe TaxID=47621 RepID=A0A5B6VZ76_9ROSI|nr:hypothetical protein EPI10_024678 [Gossypium australe]